MRADGEKKKLLMMGRRNAGKTCIHSLLFADVSVEQLRFNPYTNYINEIEVSFLGHRLHINDCGGQDTLMEHYTKEVPDKIFSSVEFLIYVIDVQLKDEQDLSTFSTIVELLLRYSPAARVFVLLHKIDLIGRAQRAERLAEVRRLAVGAVSCAPALVDCFGTSIYDETLYFAWSHIIKHVIPDIAFFNAQLRQMMECMDADEMVLVERNTLLILGSAAQRAPKDLTRKYEQLSTIVKKFKVTCAAKAQGMARACLKSRRFTLLIEECGDNTCLIAIYYRGYVRERLASLNIALGLRWLQANMSDQNIKISL